ncbi:MAG: PhoX family phosphatase [Pseudomonadota bacterium]
MSHLINRRGVLKGTLAGAVAYLSGCTSTPLTQGASKLVGFTPVPREAADGKSISIAPEYQYQTLAPWGTPLTADAPAWQWPPSAAAQAQQVGIGHDGMTYFPLSADDRRGLLAMNHEYGSNPHILGTRWAEDQEQLLASQHAIGNSIMEIQETGGRWSLVPDSRYARRIHVNTPMVFAGPVAGHALIANKANNPVLGTMNNCANGQTPWGTYLTCEENFNFLFGATREIEPTAAQARYGLPPSRNFYNWHDLDPRFDMANPDYANESNRFGWVVEIDPRDPDTPPVKRSALGRFKHEGATVGEDSAGRAVVYMGDDQQFEFVYRFVSREPWREMRKRGLSPLDEGTLYVAQFEAEGKGLWLPLTLDNPRLAGTFTETADILVHARLAATLAGATPMDRPEWVSIGPAGDVYCTLTNNSRRSAPNPANPSAPNPHGQIVRWRDEEDERFSWDHFLICADVYETENSLGSPDGLLADPDGRLFICTDGAQFEDQPNQLMVADTVTGQLSRLLVGVQGCEITGLTMTPDRRTLFVNVQHPGNGDPRVTSFPAPDDGTTIPRDCTLVVTRRDGGIVGS